MNLRSLEKLVLLILPIAGVAFSEPPSVATTSLPAGTVGVSYEATVQATGGQPPYTWSVRTFPLDGRVPVGLTLDPSSGAITGIPAVADAVLPPNTVPLGQPLKAPLVFQVTDSTGTTAIATLPISVAAAAVPSVSAVENAASFQSGSLAPGSPLSIMGSSLGPVGGVAAPTTGGAFPTDVAGVQVLFDGIAAPLLYASSGQINAIVPFEVSGRASTSIQVSYFGTASQAVAVPVAPAVPALFTALASGSGQGAILNQDLSVNSAANPAAAGSVVVLYGSGGGLFHPPIPDGVLTGANYSALVLPLTVRIGGSAATVLYAGSAPGLVAGVMQINVQIPPGTPSGNVPLAVQVNGAASQPGVTVAVR